MMSPVEICVIAAVSGFFAAATRLEI